MRKILDYSVSHTFERNRSTYFCGKKEGEDQPVIIQILDPHLFSAVEIARLKIDYDLIKTLNITGTQKIIDFTPTMLANRSCNFVMISPNIASWLKSRSKQAHCLFPSNTMHCQKQDFFSIQ